MIRVVSFDIDDTLCDFHSASYHGLVGEHLNWSWDGPWMELTGGVEMLPFGEGAIGKRPERARYYHHMLRRWGAPRGETARHITSEVNFTSRAILEDVQR